MKLFFSFVIIGWISSAAAAFAIDREGVLSLLEGGDLSNRKDGDDRKLD